MKNYQIEKIIPDFIERFITVTDVDKKKLFVHFMEYNECLDAGEESQIRKPGDIICGNLAISLVINTHKTDEKLYYIQRHEGYPSIEAVVEVIEIVDEYTIFANSTLSDTPIKIEFENAQHLEIGDNIWISGSLELN